MGKFCVQEKANQSWIGQPGFKSLLDQLRALLISMKIVWKLFLTFSHASVRVLKWQILKNFLVILGHPRIIHRDIKAANILLDFNFEAMVSIRKAN